ncbi:MAG: hypothetical protein HZC40_13145 [Chloroflexi bacterium]|nr:hypothetical protein [Chloroflexota bacterium]
MTALTDWLLEGPAWVQYRARVDLLMQKENHPAVITARQAMLADPQIRAVIQSVGAWERAVINSHKSAGHALHQLAFLADLGLRADDPGMNQIIARVMQHQSAEGPFQMLMNIPKHFGGAGKDEWAWALCDAPTIAYALVKFGLGDDPHVQRAIEHLTTLIRDNGFPCAVSRELGKFRGPGRKDDPCPYANLVMLKTLAQIPRARTSRASRIAVETLLALWTESAARHPYMFFMGTDFRKLKTPLVWYDILHVLDVVTQFPFARQDSRVRDIAQIVSAKADAEGRWTPESVWQAWDEWEFGQKKIPSRWLTLIAQRAQARLN